MALWPDLAYRDATVAHNTRGIRWRYRKQYLSEKRLTSAQNLLAKRQLRNEAIDLADCLQFCDKRDIVIKSEKLYTGIGFLSKTESKTLLEDLEELRNNLAHAQDIITGQWPKIIDLAEQAELLLQRCEEVAISPEMAA